mgnify:CR=1 FL=1
MTETESLSEKQVQKMTIVGGLAVIALGFVMANAMTIGAIGGALAGVTGADVATGTAVGGAVGGSIWVGAATATTSVAGPATGTAGFIAGVESSGGAVALGGA